MKLLAISLILFGISSVTIATEAVAKQAINPGDRDGEEHAVFDGRVYNGKFYPRLEIIEWNEENLSSHMEFQNYTPSTAMDMSFQLEDRDGKKVMMVRYHIKGRNEYVCRRVLAPQHFAPGKPLYYYRDKNDQGRDIIFVSEHQLPEKSGRTEYKPAPYASCELPAAVANNPSDNIGTEGGRVPAAAPQTTGADSQAVPVKKKPVSPYQNW